MIIFDGTYSWDGKKHGNREPISWFPGSYDLEIYRLPGEQPGVTLLKPYLCIFAETGDGHSISANPEKFAKQVCADFSLELDRVLWVEKLSRERFEVVVFSRSSKLAGTWFYEIDRRPPTASEAELIRSERG